jgi:hypothetical protein
MRRIFLACPYGHADSQVVGSRFDFSNEVAAIIVRSGNAVFSQVSMSHPINQWLKDTDNRPLGQLWGPIDEIFMEAMDELIVADASGWKESAGVQREIAFFEQRGRRVSLWSEVAAEFVPGESQSANNRQGR